MDTLRLDIITSMDTINLLEIIMDLEMLGQREQLMEDIDCIVDDFFYENYNGDSAERDELIRTLCDAVCRNFPTHDW